MPSRGKGSLIFAFDCLVVYKCFFGVKIDLTVTDRKCIIEKLGLDDNLVHFLVSTMEAAVVEARNNGLRGSVAHLKNISFSRAAGFAALTMGICSRYEIFTSSYHFYLLSILMLL